MNKDNAKDYLPLVQALADGKTVQFLRSDGVWEDIDTPIFDTFPEKYRIKPETIKYKTAIVKSNYRSYNINVMSVLCEKSASSLEKDESFIKWVSDWVEVEV